MSELTINADRPAVELTGFELLQLAWEKAEQRKNEASLRSSGETMREFALAMTAIEDAQMRYTRGIARLEGVNRPVDLENTDAIAERRAFLDKVEAERNR